MKLRLRLLLILVLLGWVPLALYALFSDSKTRDAIVENAEKHLGQIRDLKALQIESYIEKIGSQARVLSRTPLLVEEMEQLPAHFHQLTAEQAFHHYIYENPYPLGELNQLEDAGDGSGYSAGHRRIHRLFDQVVHEYGLYDLLLIDTQGNVIYSAEKEPDFASNLYHPGEYKGELRKVYQKAMQQEDVDGVVFSDVAPYFPSSMQEAGFVGSPIGGPDQQLLGVLIMQYSTTPISEIVNSREGMEPGAKVLLLQQRGESEFKFLNDVGMSWEQLVKTERFHRKASKMAQPQAPIIRALRGEVDSSHVTTLHGKLFAAWRPVTPMQWGLVVRIDEALLLADVNQDRHSMVALLVVLLLLILAVAWIQSSTLIRPIQQLLTNTCKVANQDFSLTLDTAHSDELGDLNRAFVQMGADLKQANRVKDDFLASMSHELRTPLTTIIGNCEFLSELEQNPDKQRLVRTIEVSGRSQLALVNDILDMSKIESGKFTIDKVPFNLNTLLTDIERMFSVKMRDKGLHFDIEQQHSFSHKVVGDGQRIGQVLINLLGNAVKFTEQGSVALRAWTNEEQELCFSVKDSGIGMSPEVRDRLFQRFEQADNTISRRFGGTGLGLYISKILVELMEGRIEVYSEEEQGSEFRICLPYETGDPIARRDHRRVNEPQSILNEKFSGHVLVAEDTPELQLLERRILESFGVEVIVANNGGEAVEHAMAQPFDLILMDMQMPVLSGIEATEVLRNQGNQTPIVALTANVMQKHRDAFDRAGCNDFLEKPINKQDLLGVLKQYLPSQERATMRDELVDDELVTMFLKRVNKIRPELVAAYEHSLWETLHAAAHVLKGGGASFGYLGLTEKATLLCDAIDREQYEWVPDFYQQLISEIEQIIQRD